jgi:hypothetical protein
MNKFAKVGGWSTVLFLMVIAASIGLRMDQHTISVLAGVVSGFVVACVMTALVAWIMLRRERPQPAPVMQQRMYAPMPQAPVNVAYAAMPYVVAPPNGMWPAPHPAQAAPGYGMPMGEAYGQVIHTQRKFYMIGTSGDVHELNPALEAPQGLLE